MPALKTLSRFVALLFVLPSLAQADAYTGLTYGSGPDGYRSYAFLGDADIFKTVKLSLDHFLAKSAGADDMRQTGLGLTWNAIDLISANYRYSTTNDGIFKVKGNEGGLAFALDTLWEGDLRTSLDLGYGDFKYDPATPPANATSRTLTQTRRSYGFSQDIVSSFTLYGSHDEYKYDRNVVGLAILLIRRTRNNSKAAFSLLAFPDKTNTLGMSWKPSDALTLDLSFGKTNTLLKQELKNTRLGLDYQINNKLNIAIAVTRSASSAVTNNNGVTVQQASRETYSEMTAGWAF